MQCHSFDAQRAVASKDEAMTQDAEIQFATNYAAKAGKHFIGGDFVDGETDRHILSINPSTGGTSAEVQAGGDEEIDRAVRAAHKCFTTIWSKTSPRERERIIRNFGMLLESRADKIAALDAVDAGVLYSMLRTAGKAMLVDCVDYFAGWPTKFAGQNFAPFDRPGSPGRTTRLTTDYLPIGVVGCIIPWNAPATFVVTKAIPALAAGCTVVIKPSENSPVSALYIAELLCEAGLPEGAFNVVNGEGETAGAALVRHPLVRKISFTGSSEVGKIIAAQSAPTLKRLTLELGGKSAFIVMKDADLDTAAMTACFAGYFLSGQFCMCPSRLFVEKSVQQAFFDKLSQISSGLKVGESWKEDSAVGPVITATDRDRIATEIERAQSAGAQLLFGGHAVDRPGNFVEPTLLIHEDTTTRAAQEEIFGPVLLGIPFDQNDLEGLIANANATRYGLAASVWTRDLHLAHMISSRLEAGLVSVNDHATIDPMFPFGGLKDSGIGQEYGRAGFAAYLEPKSVAYCY